MKTSKRFLSAVLSLSMVLSMLCVPAIAAGEPTISFTVDKETVEIGETVTVTITNKDMTVSGWGGYLTYDATKLECTSVKGGRSGEKWEANGYLYNPDEESWVKFTLFEGVEDTQKDGSHSFGLAAIEDVTYDAGTVSVLTFTAKAEGTVEFVLTEDSSGADAYKNVAARKELSITVPVVGVDSVTLSKTTLDLSTGESETLIATVKPDNATDKTVDWTSSNKDVATVDSNGKVTAVAEGTATITATADGKSATCVVTVTCAHTGGTATCAAKAVCSVCGNEYGEKNPANHTGDTETKDAVTESCKDDGYTGDTYCKSCGVKLADGSVIPATGAHVDADSKWESDGINHYHTCSCGTVFDTVACSGGTATCVAKAVCSVCGNEYGEKNPANHTGDTETKGAVTESCKDDGYTGDTYCKSCGVKLADGSVIPATGEHVDADGKWESDGTNHYHTCACGTAFDTAACSGGTATCAAKAVCSVCGNEYGEKNPENHTGETEIKNAVPVSCKDDGYTGDTYCKGCGVKLADGSVIPATGEHVDADGKWESDGTNHYHTCACGTAFDTAACFGGTATCATKAVCSVCGNEYGEKNPENHTGETEIKNAVPVSCKDDGYTGDIYCKGCGVKLADGSVIPATGEHVDADGKWESDATNHYYTCACGTQFGAEAHKWVEVAEAAYLKSAATCSAKAVYYKSCETCLAAGTETFESGEINPDAHVWGEDGQCTNPQHVKTENEVKPGQKVQVEVPTTIFEIIEEKIEEFVAEVWEVIEQIIVTNESYSKLFKAGTVGVEGGKLVYELQPDAPVGEYTISVPVDEAGNVYVISVVVEKVESDYDRPARPTTTPDAVKNVIEMIDELPSAKKVTLGDQKDIETARKAYDALTKANQAKVTNYDDLVAAEEALEALLEAPVAGNNPFVDVADDVYYTDAVLWAVENNITSGTSANTFSPDAVCTRAQVVTFLWRAAGSPAPLTTGMPFTDVEAGAYYAAAVQWAVENNITTGASATTFDPNGKCTRAQIVTFLWRAQGNPAAAAVNSFVDVEADAYYAAPVLWAVANGITNGTSATTFGPAADCTRAQVVTFLYRCMAE